ncbi:hypothetical protein V2J56_14550 [Georgenia sp. MJ206]|uniref:hypothetical protein n=1 Tax=Georgenia wangjunii TaxID=3117730 RepID=UPI002F26649B
MTGIAGEILAGAALAVLAAGLLVGLGVAVVAGVRAGVPVLLDFLIAAGLLRLAGEPSWGETATTALVVAVRHLLAAGLAAGRTWPGLTATSRSGHREAEA